MRLGYGLLAVIFLIAFPAHSDADELGAQEVRAALTGIERRCAADLPAAIATALSSINTAAGQQGVAPIEAPSTPQDVLDAFAQTLQAAPDLGEQALARTVVNSILYEVDAAVEEGYAARLACNCTAGVGLELRSSPPNQTIVKPLPGTPAEQAGLLPNDILIAVNGTDTAGLPLAQVVRLLWGEPGSTVAITVRRAGETEPQTFNITRVIIRVRAVTWSVDDGVGYIRVRSFTEDTGRAVRDALRDIRRQVRAPRGHVLDLRNNSGGLLDQVIEVADLFLDGGAVVTVRSARVCPAEEPQVYNARRGDEARGAPLIVLTNSSTASGAEALAIALVERGRAQTIGQTTFGMGQVSTVVPLSERASMRLVTGELASPSGRSIAGGLRPNVEVPETAVAGDPVLTRAKALLPPLAN